MVNPLKQTREAIDGVAGKLADAAAETRVAMTGLAVLGVAALAVAVIALAVAVRRGKTA